MAAQAAHEGVDDATISDQAYEALCSRVSQVLDDYMQTHFYERVNAMHLSDGTGPIRLGHERDDKGNVLSMALQSVALVHKAYELAQEAVPAKLRGTLLYAPALRKAQNYFIAGLAQSGLWACEYQSDYKDAKQLLMVAREDYSKTSPSRGV